MFILIFLISLVALVVGLIRPSLFSRIFGSGSRKRVGLILGLSTFVLFIIAVATTPTPPKQEATADQNAPAVEQAAEATQPTTPTPAPQPQSIEDRIKAIAVKTGTTDLSYKGIENQKADPDRPAGSRMITVSLNMGEFFTASSMYRDTGEVTSRIFREAFTDPNVYDVIVWYYGDTTDQYGKKENDIILSQAIDKKTFLKIVWDNFDSSKLCDFLKSEGRINGGETTCVALANIK